MRLLDLPKDPIEEIRAERVGDWAEDGLHLRRLFEKYEAEYAAKICSKCTKERQRQRGCCTDVINGNKVRHCDHMRLATHKRLSKQIDAHIYSHPAFANARVPVM